MNGIAKNTVIKIQNHSKDTDFFSIFANYKYLKRFNY